jgi:hypothetical protein
MRYQQLTENKDYALAKKAKANLSHDASKALDNWEHMNWDQGTLSTDHEVNGEIAQELYAAFQHVRDQMRERHGDTIRLYRGMQDESGVRDSRKLFSWTSSKKMAEIFAGRRNDRQTQPEPITDAEISAAVAKYNKTGFTSFRGRKFKQNKQNPEYYDMFNKNGHITDGDDIERDLTDMQKTYADYLQRFANDGRVVERDIPIDDIVWVLMGGNANEYIVSGYAE